MNTRFTRFFAGAAVALSLLGAASFAQASALSSSQVSAILSLLQSFGADQSVINNVSSALGGSGDQGSTLSCSSFSDVSFGDFDETPGGRVSQLQTWLGIPSSTFGFGTYGKKTQAAWNAKCGGMTPVTPPTCPSGSGWDGTQCRPTGLGSSPTATIDQSALTQTEYDNARTITVSGTALNTDRVAISIKGQASVFANVVNGHWSAFVYNVYPNVYTVQILNENSAGSKEETLVSATLTVVSGGNTNWPSLTYSPVIKAGAQGDTWAEGSNIDGLVISIQNNSMLTQQITFPTNCWYTYKIYNANTGGLVFDLASQQQCAAPGAWPATTFTLNPGDSKNIDFMHQNSLFHLSPGSYVMKVDVNSTNVVKEAVQFRFNVAANVSSLAQCPANAVNQRGQINQTFKCACPANFSIKPIWGWGAFTDDSDICTAGAWVGEVSPASGGEVDYTISAGQNSYQAAPASNSITSGSWGAWPGSFQISGPKG